MTRSSWVPVCLAVLALAIVVPSQPQAGETVSAATVLRDFMEIGQAKLTASDGAPDDVFGNAIAIDGDTAVIAAPWDQDNGVFSGSAYVFVRADGRWVEQAKLVPSDGRPYGLFGYSAAIDGDTIAIGALGSDPDWGSAYVFTRTGGVWSEQARLLPADGAEIDYLGHSVAIDGDTVVVGAPDWNFYIDPGSAYVFTRTDGQWSQQAQLEVPWVRAGHKFGHEVALDGDTAIVSGFGVGPDYGGAAYVFAREDGLWIFDDNLEPRPRKPNDYFGFGLALQGDTAVVGAPRDDRDGDSTGAVYVYTRRDDSWIETAVLRPDDADAPAWFGKIVSLDDGTLLVGAPYDDDNGEWSGSAYAFSLDDGEWAERWKVLAMDGAAWDGFGFGLALDGITAIIGAPFREGEPCGAYVYRLRMGRDLDPPR